jgi:hypothetical protein
VQVDKSSDDVGLSVLFAFVRYLYNSEVEDEMHMCKPLHNNAEGENVCSYYNSQCPSLLTVRVCHSCDAEKFKLSSDGADKQQEMQIRLWWGLA